MSGSPKRFFKITGIIVLLLGAILIVGGYVATNRIEETIREKLLTAGFQTKAVTVSLLHRAITVDSMAYQPADTSLKNPHKIFIQKIKVDGFHVFAFLKKKEVIVDDVIIDEGSVQWNKNYKLKKDSTGNSSTSANKIKSIQVNYVAVTHVAGAVLNDTTIESAGFIDDFELSDLKLVFANDTTFSVGRIETHLEKLQQSKKGGLHSISVGRVDYNSKNGHLEADSFRIYSPYNKTDFARVAKIQKTRLDITLPKVILDGIDQSRMFSDSTLVVKRITVSKPAVHAYRDKHYPFVRDWIMPLPIEGIKRLPVKLNIDSILIHDANIAYEEFSEKGLRKTGTITFNHLEASFAGLNTEVQHPDKKSFCTLVTDCKVMDNGTLHATFKLPLNPKVDYQAYGNVKNMDLKSLNPSLGNLSRIEIRDGRLNDLHFNFAYNDDVSNGEVLINYSDLKLQALKKEKTHEVNKLLTTAINAIVKSDKDKTVDKSKRTGIIDIERDKKRFVFQLWWKSILDGLQSTFVNNGKKKKTHKGSSK